MSGEFDAKGMRARHLLLSRKTMECACGFDYPCDTIRALDRVDELTELVDIHNRHEQRRVADLHAAQNALTAAKAALGEAREAGALEMRERCAREIETWRFDAHGGSKAKVYIAKGAPGEGYTGNAQDRIRALPLEPK